MNNSMYGTIMNIMTGSFIWDTEKEAHNISKHGIDFNTASKAFKDPKRKIYIDSKHSRNEERFFCVGEVDRKVITVRFTYRKKKIRIIGAVYWRKGEQYYEKND